MTIDIFEDSTYDITLIIFKYNQLYGLILFIVQILIKISGG